MRFFSGGLPKRGDFPRVSEKKAEEGLVASGSLHYGSHHRPQKPPLSPEDLVQPGPSILHAGHCRLRPLLVKTAALLAPAR